MKRILLSLAVCAGFGWAEAAPIVLENEALAIHFSQAGSGFAVTSIVNRLVGASRFVATNLREPDFWEIRLVNDEGANPRKAVRLYNHTPSRVRRVGINGDTPSRKLVKQGFRAVFPSSGASGAESEP